MIALTLLIADPHRAAADGVRVTCGIAGYGNKEVKMFIPSNQSAKYEQICALIHETSTRTGAEVVCIDAAIAAAKAASSLMPALALVPATGIAPATCAVGMAPAAPGLSCRHNGIKTHEQTSKNTI